MEALLKTLHVLSIVVWVGGMVFAHFFLRPAVATLEPPLRLKLMHEVLGRFFAAVLVASLLAWASGVWLLGRIARRVVQAGGNFDMPWHWWLMAVGGTLMVAIFLHVRFALFQRLRRAVTAQDWPAGGAAMAQVRQWVAVNLAIGLVIVVAVLLGGS
ncbi:CopD family protein [Aquincola sp. J276]|uniref:CopD family protein n=1 Tax=Aquincola sp. J276 TaxID=2898432 RepID=UPI002151FB99|nr:CopD family protein [Aquincola sp. J276]MCR5866514.1 CopD family protein [Aquincola sp. J276]